MNKLIKEIKKEMLHWFSFNLTDNQIIEFLLDNPIEFFDTYEREQYAEYLAQKITGLRYPMNGDSTEYQNEFFKKLHENAINLGYEIIK